MESEPEGWSGLREEETGPQMSERVLEMTDAAGELALVGPPRPQVRAEH